MNNYFFKQFKPQSTNVDAQIGEDDLIKGWCNIVSYSWW